MLEKPLARKDGKPERAVLVGLATRDQPRALLAEYLDELEFLARTANAETIRSFTQSLDHPVRLRGKGKLQEITTYIEENDIDLLIFDDELSHVPLRNSERPCRRPRCSTRRPHPRHLRQRPHACRTRSSSPNTSICSRA